MDAIPIPEAMKPYMPLAKGILIAIAILVVGWIVSKWASRLTRRTFSQRKLDQAPHRRRPFLRDSSKR